MYRRKLLPDGTLGLFEPVFEGELLPEQQIEMLGMQLAMEKITNMQTNAEKDAIIDSFGSQIIQMKLEIMAMKGGGV